MCPHPPHPRIALMKCKDNIDILIKMATALTNPLQNLKPQEFLTIKYFSLTVSFID